MNTNLKTGMKIMTYLKLFFLSLMCVLYLHADQQANTSTQLCNSSEFIWINLPLDEYMQLSDKEKEQFTKDHGELMAFRGLNRMMNKNVYFDLTEKQKKEIALCQMSSMFNGTIGPEKLRKMTDQERGKALLKLKAPPEIQAVIPTDINKKLITLLEQVISDENETTSVIFNQYIDDPGKLKAYRAAIIASNEAVLEIQKIIQNNFDIDSNIEFDQTLLMHASFRGNLKLTKLLVEKNANLNLMNANGFTSVTLATYYGYKEITKYLIDHNADLTKGKPFIFYGIRFNEKNIIDKYIEQGGNLNIQENGTTCLVRGIVLQDVTLDTIKHLVSQGADIYYITPDGRNLIQLAHDYGREDIAAFLISLK